MIAIFRDYALLYRYIDWGTCAVWCALFVSSIAVWGGIALLLFR